MKLLLDRVALRDALQKVEMGIDRKPTRPVLGGVRLHAENGGLLVEATDQEIAVRCRLEQVQVEEPGWGVIPGRELVEVVRDLEADTLTLSLGENGQCEILGSEDRCVLISLENGGPEQAPEQFPAIPILEGEPAVVMDKAVFLQMVGSTRFATSKVHDTRFATEGVLFEVREGNVTLVGTDGRRLACIRRPALSCNTERQRSVLLPKVLDQILRCAGDEAGESLEIFFLQNLVGFRVGGLESFGRVLEGEYPNYDNVIPATGKHIVRAHREALVRKLRLASHLTAEAAAVVRIQVSPDQLEVSAEHEGRGRAAATLEVDYTGSGLAASFNPGYLMDGLKAAHSEQVEIQMDEGTRPAKFVLGEDYTYVVMPLTTFA